MASKLTLCHTSAAADPKLYPYLYRAHYQSEAGVPYCFRRMPGTSMLHRKLSWCTYEFPSRAGMLQKTRFGAST